MKVLVINAHSQESEIFPQIYKKVHEGVFDAGHKLEKINFYDEASNLKKTSSKKDSFLFKVQKMIKETDGLILILPRRWSQVPSEFKVFMENVFNHDYELEKEKMTIKIPIVKKKLMLKKTITKGLLKKVLLVTTDTTQDKSQIKRNDSSFKYISKRLLKRRGAKKVKNQTIKLSKKMSLKQDEILEKSYRIGKKF